MPTASIINALDTRQFEVAFGSHLPLPAGVDTHLAHVILQVLRNPGSLVRPQITYQMAASYGLSEERAQDLAIAVEYFHTASLLFDDLPSMDDADQRRGAPCVHLVFGEASAILAALALINRAYALCWRAVSGCGQDCQRRALAYLEQRLGVDGLLNGQSMDLHYYALRHDLQTTERIAIGKTVSLIRLTLVLPAILGGASADELQSIERIAMFWGLSYQIADDLKDVLQSSLETGKTAARDGSLDRPNIALAVGLPGAIDRLTRLLDLGDVTLGRLLIRRPSLSFLGRLRNDLQDEVVGIMRSASEIALRETA